MTLTVPWELERDQLLPVRLVAEVVECQADRSPITYVAVEELSAVDSMGEPVSMTDDEAIVAESVIACAAEAHTFCPKCHREEAGTDGDECEDCQLARKGIRYL